ncbi:MAG: hypothetical protein KGY50_03365 [Candidatus Thermoplasmatota archaeon]|nr:hypothetical protein [Candidatus Thermoplasmatota archaeon]
MLQKDKDLYRLKKDALISSFHRQGFSHFEARCKAVLSLANNAIHLDYN